MFVVNSYNLRLSSIQKPCFSTIQEEILSKFYTSLNLCNSIEIHIP